MGAALLRQKACPDGPSAALTSQQSLIGAHRPADSSAMPPQTGELPSDVLLLIFSHLVRLRSLEQARLLHKHKHGPLKSRTCCRSPQSSSARQPWSAGAGAVWPPAAQPGDAAFWAPRSRCRPSWRTRCCATASRRTPGPCCGPSCGRATCCRASAASPASALCGTQVRSCTLRVLTADTHRVCPSPGSCSVLLCRAVPRQLLTTLHAA